MCVCVCVCVWSCEAFTVNICHSRLLGTSVYVIFILPTFRPPSSIYSSLIAIYPISLQFGMADLGCCNIFWLVKTIFFKLLNLWICELFNFAYSWTCWCDYKRQRTTRVHTAMILIQTLILTIWIVQALSLHLSLIHI